MAIDAAGARAVCRMVMVRFRGKFGRQMTLTTDRITRGIESLAVRIMAVAAGDTGLVHSALGKRTPDENFVLNLPVGVIATVGEQGGHKMIQKLWVTFGGPGKGTASGMTISTDFDFS